MEFATLPKLKAGDTVGIVAPSAVLSPIFPGEYQLGLARIREQFGLNPVELPHVHNPNATAQEQMSDLIEAFSRPDIKAVITTIGGNHQVEYVHKLPVEPFRDNPKPFFGYSDNTHFGNFLFMNGIPSFYGGCVFTEFARQGAMDSLTCEYLNAALFSGGELSLKASPEFNDIDVAWGVPENLSQRRRYQPSDGWHWNGQADAQGVTWGGCLESIDEILRCGRELPALADFERIVLFLETSEELPSHHYVGRVLRALGERSILSRVQAVLVGRAKAWSFESPQSDEKKDEYKLQQRQEVVSTVRRYNQTAPIVQNMDFGHTAPSICLPFGAEARVRGGERTVSVRF